MASRTALRSLQTSCRRAALSKRTLATHASNRERVNIIEVGPRDGLQNEKGVITPEQKLELIRRLAKTGLSVIEAGSFVSPKWTPQMAASNIILESILQSPPESQNPILYQFLVPNQKGMDNFIKSYTQYAGSKPAAPKSEGAPALNTSSQDANAMPSSQNPLDAMSTGSAGRKPEIEVSIFTAATETFTRKNTNCSIAESLERFKPIFAHAKENGVAVRGYISVALGCPYEGVDVDPKAVADLAVTLLEMGSNQISVCDTTGMGTVTSTRNLLKTLAAAGIESKDLALHFHDTYGQALPNTLVGLEHGVRHYDSAVSGLGGCPYSPGATGNVATEDMVHLFESMGLDTGVDLVAMAETGAWISKEIGRANESRAGKAMLARIASQQKQATAPQT